ncbi:hypothetical protein LZ554_002770 [Drepanopeziza brunnea f. sp. 'monogermtubi']|nr:hypothetical protein LZ554_002770 [Drepanopeziza brunnea f. sp. 'monogermtubi']
MATRQPTEKEAFFFLTILSCMTNKPEVNWDLVAERAGYSNASCAKVRFGQIKKAIGYKNDGTHPITTPVKDRAAGKKVKNEIGSGTNVNPGKVTKKRSPKKPKAVKLERELEAEEGDNGNTMKEEAGGPTEYSQDTAAEYADEQFEDPIHERLYHDFQATSQHQDEFLDAES